MTKSTQQPKEKGKTMISETDGTTAEVKKKRIRKAKTPKAVQPDFPVEGMAQKQIAEIEECAERYVDARDERIAAMAPEKKEKSLLMALMKKHDVKLYKYDGKIVELVSKEETVKVRKTEDEDVAVDEDDSE